MGELQLLGWSTIHWIVLSVHYCFIYSFVNPYFYSQIYSYFDLLTHFDLRFMHIFQTFTSLGSKKEGCPNFRPQSGLPEISWGHPFFYRLSPLASQLSHAFQAVTVNLDWFSPFLAHKIRNLCYGRWISPSK